MSQYEEQDEWNANDEEKWLEECVQIIGRKFALEKAEYEDMDSFLMYKTLVKPPASPGVYDNYYSADNNLQVSIVEYGAFNNKPAWYFFGLFTLQKEFPVTYIFPETLHHKINNLFTKSDLDFKDYKKFSGKFQVTTQDRNRLETLLLHKNLDELTAFPEMEVEINGKLCLFRTSHQSFDEEEAAKFAELATVLKRILY